MTKSPVKPSIASRFPLHTELFMSATCGAMWIALVVVGGTPARADDPTPLVCGQFVTRTLAAGATNQIKPVAAGTGAVLVEATDMSGTIGALKLSDDANGTTTCSGSLATEAGEPHPDVVAISDCLGTDSGTYSVGFTVVSDAPESCAQTLGCGGGPTLGNLTVQGDVNSYALAVAHAGSLEIVTNPVGSSSQSVDVRLRLFSPTGVMVADSCSKTLTVDVEEAGRYTLLASDCYTVGTGTYSIQWQQQPSCPAQPQSGELVYVVNGGSGSVAVLDAATQQVVSLIPLVPYGGHNDLVRLVVSPNQAFAYVSFPETSTISVVDTAKNRTAGFISHLDGDQATPRSVAVDPAGTHVYVVSETAGGIIDVLAANRRAVGVIPVADTSAEDGIAIHPNGSVLYVPTKACAAGSCTQGIAIVDVATSSVVGHVEGITQIHGESFSVIRFNPSGTLAYALSFRRVLVIDTATRAVVTTLPIDANDVAFDATQQRAYFAAEEITIVNTASNVIVDSFAIPGNDFPAGLALSRDGRLLYVTNYDAEFDPSRPRSQDLGLAIVDLTSKVVIGSLPTFGSNPSDVEVVAAPQGLCTGDAEAETKVTIGELVSSVNYAIDGCPTDPQTVTTAASRAKR